MSLNYDFSDAELKSLIHEEELNSNISTPLHVF